jgi:hypothetical protein
MREIDFSEKNLRNRWMDRGIGSSTGSGRRD